MKILEGKTIVITGAGGGLGESYARHAAKLGAKLLINDVAPGSVERVVAEIKAEGGVAAGSAGDISSWSYGAFLIDACVRVYGRIDGLVNNAGILRHGHVTEMTESDLRAMLEVNTIGTAGCATHAIRTMLSQGSPASVVNVTSGSQAGDIAIGGYGASKAAVASLTFSWAMELRGTNVRINAISPLAQTMMAASNTQYLAEQSASREVAYTTLPAAELNAPVVTFLLSDRSAGINGQIVRIAGDQLSFVTHPMIADPVLTGDWSDEAVHKAFRDVLSTEQHKLGLSYARPIAR